MAGRERREPTAAELFELDGPRKPPGRRAGLFVGFWFELHEGKSRRTRRATRLELATAYRLWAEHADIRTGPVT